MHSPDAQPRCTANVEPSQCRADSCFCFCRHMCRYEHRHVHRHAYRHVCRHVYRRMYRHMYRPVLGGAHQRQKARCSDGSNEPPTTPYGPSVRHCRRRFVWASTTRMPSAMSMGLNIGHAVGDADTSLYLHTCAVTTASCVCITCSCFRASAKTSFSLFICVETCLHMHM